MNSLPLGALATGRKRLTGVQARGIVFENLDSEEVWLATHTGNDLQLTSVRVDTLTHVPDSSLSEVELGYFGRTRELVFVRLGPKLHGRITILHPSSEVAVLQEIYAYPYSARVRLLRGTEMVWSTALMEIVPEDDSRLTDEDRQKITQIRRELGLKIDRSETGSTDPNHPPN